MAMQEHARRMGAIPGRSMSDLGTHKNDAHRDAIEGDFNAWVYNEYGGDPANLARALEDDRHTCAEFYGNLRRRWNGQAP